MTEKSKFWSARMSGYVRFRMNRAFHDVLGRGLDEAKEALAAGPVILALNHVAWWDPLFLILLERSVGADGYALMAAHSLRELPFFGRLGALPLHQGSARQALSELEAAATLLDRPRRFVAIFPGGEQRPSHFPLAFQGGVVRLQRKSRVRVLPVGLRYEFLESPRPSLLFSIGAAFEVTEGKSSKQTVLELEARVTEELGRIDQEIRGMMAAPAEPPQGFQSLLHRAPRPLRAGRVPLAARVAALFHRTSARPRRLGER